MFPPIQSATYRLRLYDPSGKLVWGTRRRKAKSYLKNMIETLYLCWRETSRTIVDIDDVSQTAVAPSSTSTKRSWWNTTVVPTEGGLAVGSGNAAVTISDTKLNTKIADGSGSGQLEYRANVVAAPILLGADTFIYITQAFSNRSGADVTVEEIGIESSWGNNSVPTWTWLWMRDIVTAVVIPDGFSLVVDYKLQISL